MSAADRPSITDIPGVQTQSVDILGQASVSDMRAAAKRDPVASTAEPQANHWPPSVELICCGSVGQKEGESSLASAAGPSAKAPGPENQTRAQAPQGPEAAAGQVKVNDQTKTPKDGPVELSPMAKQMQLLQKEADKNANLIKHGLPVADLPSHPGDKPQLPKPVDSKQYVFDQSQYQDALQKAEREHKPLIFDFGATWCPACQGMERTAWPKVDDAIKGKAILVKINTDLAPGLMNQFGVTNLPTTVIAQPGKNGGAPIELKRYVGGMSADTLRQRLNQYLQ
jgi:thiol-disulfide isomerase/thioredoxin